MRQAIIDVVGPENFDLVLAIVAIVPLVAVIILTMLYGFGLLPRLPLLHDEEPTKEEDTTSTGDGDGSGAD